MKQFKSQSIVFYGSRELVNQFLQERFDENGCLTIEGHLHGKTSLVKVYAKRFENGYDSYVKLQYGVQDEMAMSLAIHLMKDFSYLRSVAQIYDAKKRMYTVFDLKEEGFDNCYTVFYGRHNRKITFLKFTEIINVFWEPIEVDYKVYSAIKLLVLNRIPTPLKKQEEQDALNFVSKQIVFQ